MAWQLVKDKQSSTIYPTDAITTEGHGAEASDSETDLADNLRKLRLRGAPTASDIPDPFRILATSGTTAKGRQVWIHGSTVELVSGPLSAWTKPREGNLVLVWDTQLEKHKRKKLGVMMVRTTAIG